MKNTLILSVLAMGIAGIITGCCCGSNSNCSNSAAPQQEEVAMETIQIIPCPVCSKQMQQNNQAQNSKHPHIAACTSGKCENSAGKEDNTSGTGNTANQ